MSLPASCPLPTRLLGRWPARLLESATLRLAFVLPIDASLLRDDALTLKR